jgi:hypothetical protein
LRLDLACRNRQPFAGATFAPWTDFVGAAMPMIGGAGALCRAPGGNSGIATGAERFLSEFI